MGNTKTTTAQDRTTAIETSTVGTAVRQLHFKPDLIRFSDKRRADSLENLQISQKGSAMQTEHLSPSAMGLPTPVSAAFKPGNASRYRDY